MPGAGHGYMCEARSDYRPAPAAHGWATMLDLFDATLAGRPGLRR